MLSRTLISFWFIKLIQRHLNQASAGRRRPRRPWFSNSLLPPWYYCVVSQKLCHLPRRPWARTRTFAATLGTGKGFTDSGRRGRPAGAWFEYLSIIYLRYVYRLVHHFLCWLILHFIINKFYRIILAADNLIKTSNKTTGSNSPEYHQISFERTRCWKHVFIWIATEKQLNYRDHVL